MTFYTNKCKIQKENIMKGGILMDKYNNLKANIDSFLEERIQESYGNLSNTKEYNKMLKEYYDLFSKIETLVRDDKLTEKYKETEYELYMFQLKEAYKIGFNDNLSIFMKKNDNV